MFLHWYLSDIFFVIRLGLWILWIFMDFYEKVSFHSNPKERRPQRIVCSNYHTIALISHASKVMLKILQARLQQNMNCELLDVQVGFRKGRRTRDQIVNIRWIIEKAREFQKKISTSASLTMLNPLTVWITTNCGKFWKRWEYQTSWHALRKSVCRSRSNSSKQICTWTCSKLGKEYIKALYCHLAYLTYMQSVSCKMSDWMKHKLEPRLLGEI